MKTIAIPVAIILVTGAFVTSPAMAWDQDFFGIYFQRTDKITLSAGNAKEVNAATQVIDPWPRYIGQRRIRFNGERIVGAAERYRDFRLHPIQSPITFPPIEGGGGGGGGAK
jgi:hypothetical protein